MATGFSSCCISGHIHEGTPTGVVEKIVGLDTYIAKSDSGSKAKTIVLISDILGWTLPNLQLLADEYAKAGFYVYVPDFLNGDLIPTSMLNTVAPREPHKRSSEQVAADKAKTSEVLGPWLQRNPESVVRPRIDKFLAHLRADGQTGKIGSVGYCWGALYTVGLLIDGALDAGVASHPSFVTEAMFTSVVKPTQVNVGTNDIFTPTKVISQIKAAMEQKLRVPFEVNVIEGAVHGFAIRGDQTSPREKEVKEERFANSVRWFNKYLT